MPTIRDVARRAEVSVSTVSLTLNSPDRVGDATRNRVLAAVDALGFVPKAEAVARARRGVGRVGVLAPYSTYPSVARRLTGMLDATRERPVEVVLFDQDSAAHRTSPLLGSLPVTGRLDGFVVVSHPLDEAAVRRLHELRLPTVLVDIRHPGFDSVRTDDVAGGALAAGHLLSRGYRRFAFLGEAQESDAYVSPSQRRLDGFRTTLASAGHEPGVRLCPHRVGPAAEVALEMIAGREPIAVFAASDTLAAGVVQAARRLGAAVPGDVAVVGFDDGELAEGLDLTTVRQPLEESGRTAMDLLLQRLDGRGGPPRDVALGLELAVRGTT